MATTSQIKKIHILKSKLKIDDDLYREMLSEFGVKSSTELDYNSAKSFLEPLEEKAEALNLWEKQTPKYSDLNRSNRATPSQLRCIEGLWRDKVAHKKEEIYVRTTLRHYLQTRFHINDVMFLTKNKASDVILGIQGIIRHKEKSAATL